MTIALIVHAMKYWFIMTHKLIQNMFQTSSTHITFHMKGSMDITSTFLINLTASMEYGTATLQRNGILASQKKRENAQVMHILLAMKLVYSVFLFGSGSPTGNHLISCEIMTQVARESSYEM